MWCSLCSEHHPHGHQHHDVLAALTKDLEALEEKAEKLMAEAQELRDAASRVNDSANAAVTRINDLENQAANTVPKTDLDPVVAALGATADALDAASGGAVAPPVVEPPVTTPFVAKVDGETYQDYVNRANAAGVPPVDEGTWNTFPVG